MADTIFYNADYIVIEYIDIIKSPYLILLDQIRRESKMKDIFKIETIEHLDYPALYEWYLNRKHQNFLIDLVRDRNFISDKDLDVLLDKQMNISPLFCQTANLLMIDSVLKVCRAKKLVNDVIIYYPHSDNFAKQDLENITGAKYTFYNNFDDVMNKAKANSTYFLSDINKVLKLKDNGLLEYSSITLPIEYRYNKKNMKEFSLDFEALFKECPFKLSYMRTCTYEEYK